jgi:hypothetical protein
MRAILVPHPSRLLQWVGSAYTWVAEAFSISLRLACHPGAPSIAPFAMGGISILLAQKKSRTSLELIRNCKEMMS